MQFDEVKKAFQKTRDWSRVSPLLQSVTLISYSTYNDKMRWKIRFENGWEMLLLVLLLVVFLFNCIKWSLSLIPSSGPFQFSYCGSTTLYVMTFLIVWPWKKYKVMDSMAEMDVDHVNPKQRALGFGNLTPLAPLGRLGILSSISIFFLWVHLPNHTTHLSYLCSHPYAYLFGTSCHWFGPQPGPL